MTLWNSVPLPVNDIWTVKDLDLLPETSLIEVIDGALIVNPPQSLQHGAIQVDVGAWLTTMSQTTEWTAMIRPGVWFGDTGVIPDLVLASVRADDTVWLNPADVVMVVEALSPTTRDRDLGRKRELYHAAGLTSVIVDPAERLIAVYDDRLNLNVEALAARLGWDRP